MTKTPPDPESGVAPRMTTLGILRKSWQGWISQNGDFMKSMSDQKQKFQTGNRASAVSIAVLCLAMNGIASRAQALGSGDADVLFDAHMAAFYRVEEGRAWLRESTEGGKASFWMRAEQMEMVLDAYERTKDARKLEMFTNLFRGFLADHGETWEKNPFNDDIMWMVIACARAHLLSGNPEILKVARANFDLCYERALSDDLGGGLWWKTDNRSKNACVNGPGSIAAFLLGKATGEEAYTAKAKSLFLWLRATLFDPGTGSVSDNIQLGGRVNPMALTYNQGTFVGAATFLGYLDEARLAATFTMNKLCRDGYLPPSGEKGDGGGFNGIGARWIARFIYGHGEERTFEPWLQKNAEAAWQGRRRSDNLSWCRWPIATPPDRRYSWGCSSAVVLLQVVRPTEIAPPEKIE
jgi:predicted alpha-1,6-mannanase (GH76 family)